MAISPTRSSGRTCPASSIKASVHPAIGRPEETQARPSAAVAACCASPRERPSRSARNIEAAFPGSVWVAAKVVSAMA